MSDIWVNAVIGLASVFGTFGGIYITSWFNNRASSKATEVEQDRVDAEAYRDARQTWKDHVDDLRGQLTALRDEQGTMRNSMIAQGRRIATLERERDEQVNQIAFLERDRLRANTRIETLEQERRSHQRRWRAAVIYIRTLLVALDDANIAHPATPPDLIGDADLELPE